jgi:predicted RNase H-like nuclease
VAVTMREQLPKLTVADDDILDALAALWTARRIQSGSATRLPSGPEERDAFGLPMQMLA